MDFISIIFSGIVSLCVSIAVNLLLDAIRKRSANREKLAELSLNLLQELAYNYKMVKRCQPVSIEVANKMISFVALSFDFRKLLSKLINLFNVYNDKIVTGGDVASLRLEEAILNVYSHPILFNGIKVGIICSPRFKRPTSGTCGHWGIAPPSFYKEHLKNFSCHYISPSNFESILECDIVINPYGEAWVLKNTEERTIFEAIGVLKRFLEKGGIWVHTGGLPFHIACDPAGRNRMEVGAEVRRQLGLSFRSASFDEETFELTEEAKRVLGDVELLPGAAYRVCTNADRVWIKFAGKALVGFKSIGKGGIIFQGGLHYRITVGGLPQFIIRIINLLCLER